MSKVSSHFYFVWVVMCVYMNGKVIMSFIYIENIATYTETFL